MQAEKGVYLTRTGGGDGAGAEVVAEVRALSGTCATDGLGL